MRVNLTDTHRYQNTCWHRLFWSANHPQAKIFPVQYPHTQKKSKLPSYILAISVDILIVDCKMRVIKRTNQFFSSIKSCPFKQIYSFLKYVIFECSLTWTRTTLQNIYVFLLLSCRCKLGHNKNYFFLTNNFDILHESVGNQKWKDNILFSVI